MAELIIVGAIALLMLIECVRDGYVGGFIVMVFCLLAVIGSIAGIIQQYGGLEAVMELISGR